MSASGGGHVDGLIAAIAGRQFGVVAWWQLAASDVTAREVRRRFESGHLIRLHKGVYAVGHRALHPMAPFRAALLACQDMAVLSHVTAAGLHHLVPLLTSPIHVTVTGHHPRHEGLVVHRARNGPAPAKGHVLAVTTPLRTLLDLAAAEDRDLTDRALAEAQARRLVGRNEIAATTGRGSRTLKDLLDLTPAMRRSEAERRFHALIKRADLPTPLTNARIAGYEVDAFWPEQRLVVEIDGYAFHHARRAFERDREKDAALQFLGYTVIRVTWRQLTERPEAVAARIARALAA